MQFRSINPISPTKRHFNKKLFALLSGISLMLFAGIMYFSFGGKTPDERPPKLPFDSAMFQGIVRIEDDRFFKYSEQEEVAASGSQKFINAIRREGRKIQYFHTDSAISIRELIHDKIKAQRDNKFVIAVYRPSEKNWYTYPEGPYLDTLTISDEDLDTFVIEAGNGFVIGAYKDFYTVEIKHGTAPSNDIYFDLNPLSTGWSLLAVENDESFEEVIDYCRNRVRSVWVQRNDTSFEKADIENPRLKPNRYLVWFLLGEPINGCVYYDAFPGSEIGEQGAGDACVSDTPVCDEDGNFYVDECEAVALGAEISNVYLAYDGLCYPPGSPPGICNALLFDPVCSVDGEWYWNVCAAYLSDPNFILGSSYFVTDDGFCLEEAPVGGAVVDDVGTVIEPAVPDGGPVDGSVQDVEGPPIEPLEVPDSGPVGGAVVDDVGPEWVAPVAVGPDEVEKCHDNTPVCSSDGTYFSNICDLLSAEKSLDRLGIYFIATDNKTREKICISRVACDDSSPVCGVDGNLYENECAAIAAGVAVNTKNSPILVINPWFPKEPSYYICGGSGRDDVADADDTEPIKYLSPDGTLSVPDPDDKQDIDVSGIDLSGTLSPSDGQKTLPDGATISPEDQDILKQVNFTTTSQPLVPADVDLLGQNADDYDFQCEYVRKPNDSKGCLYGIIEESTGRIISNDDFYSAYEKRCGIVNDPDQLRICHAKAWSPYHDAINALPSDSELIQYYIVLDQTLAGNDPGNKCCNP